jgi:hypothetical protein
MPSAVTDAPRASPATRIRTAALAARYLPARRAARIDPMPARREE